MKTIIYTAANLVFANQFKTVPLLPIAFRFTESLQKDIVVLM